MVAYFKLIKFKDDDSTSPSPGTLSLQFLSVRISELGIWVKQNQRTATNPHQI